MALNKVVHRIAIVGTGVIGASWSAQYLARGFHVVATDPAPNAEANLHKCVDDAWKALTRIGLSPGASRARLSFTTGMNAALSNADFVQENGPERPDFEINHTPTWMRSTPTDSLIAPSARVRHEAHDFRAFPGPCRPILFRAPGRLFGCDSTHFRRTPRPQTDLASTLQYGLIAEEVAKVYPELVIHGADGRIDGVCYEELAPMLLNVVQLQRSKLAAQEERMAALDLRLTAQDREIAEIKHRHRDQRAQAQQMWQFQRQLAALTERIQCADPLTARR